MYFPEFLPYFRDCRFGGCNHLKEPDCAVKAALSEGKIRAVFSMDMFNEKFDIPLVDRNLFLRPTETPVVFLQELCRVLWRAKCKQYLTVFDFIDNYEKAGRIPISLSGKEHDHVFTVRCGRERFPDDCILDFDLSLIDFSCRMEERGFKGKVKIRR